MSKHKDFPLTEVAAACERPIAQGHFILQKWTCEGCGRRLTAGNLNVLVHYGHCEHCNTVTDLDKRGCNYALIQTNKEMTLQELEQALGLAEPGLH